MLIAFSFQYFRCKVTNKRAKCKRKTCFSFQFRVVVTYLKLRINERSAKGKRVFFSIPSGSNLSKVTNKRAELQI